MEEGRGYTHQSSLPDCAHSWRVGIVKKDVCRGMRVVSIDVMWATRRIEVKGGVAQMVERSLSMREVRGSIPLSSIFFSSFHSPFLFSDCHSLSLQQTREINYLALDRLYLLILRAALIRITLRINLLLGPDSVMSFSVIPLKLRVSHSSGVTFGSYPSLSTAIATSMCHSQSGY